VVLSRTGVSTAYQGRWALRHLAVQGGPVAPWRRRL